MRAGPHGSWISRSTARRATSRCARRGRTGRGRTGRRVDGRLARMADRGGDFARDGARLSARPAHDETGMGAQPDAIAHELIALDDTDTAHRAHGELSVHDARRIEQAAAPAAAAIANALYDATGVRFRAPPFDAERIRAALARPVPADSAEAGAATRVARASPLAGRRRCGRVVGGLIGLRDPAPASIAPVVPGGADGAMWSAATLERGRRSRSPAIARCATAPGGATNAGEPRSIRRSARSTRRTSRPIRTPASARGRIRRSRARCAKASRATARTCTRRSRRSRS